MSGCRQLFSVWVIALVCLIGLCPTVHAQTQEDGRIVLEWDQSPEPDISSYVVRYGTESGVYNRVLEVGNGTTATLSSLAAGTYYCAVYARNQIGLESAPSNEVTFEIAPKPFMNVIGLNDGEFRNAGTSISLGANTSANIAKVEFYSGATKIAETNTGGAVTTWNGAAPGDTTIVAKGYNTANEVVQTSTITLHVVKPGINAVRRGKDGVFSFQITGAPGRKQHVFASTDLITWTLLESATNDTGLMEFADDEAAAMPMRFYRVESE